MELRPERRIDAFAGLVVRPEIVAEGLDDVIGRHADVGRSALEHLRDRMQDAGHGSEGRVGVPEAPDSVELAEELVGAVDEVNDHRGPTISEHRPRAEWSHSGSRKWSLSRGLPRESFLSGPCRFGPPLVRRLYGGRDWRWIEAGVPLTNERRYVDAISDSGQVQGALEA